jgi:hypothetical protein
MEIVEMNDWILMHVVVDFFVGLRQALEEKKSKGFLFERNFIDSITLYS